MPPSAIYADAIIKNANVITVNPRRPRAQSVAIRDGKFIAVGRNQDVATLQGPRTRVLDLKDKTVLPGFIDAHIHVLSAGTRHVMCADCDQRSVQAVQQALRERARSTPAGQWVQGFKFEDTKTAERRFLFTKDLDAVSTRHPIFVSHRAGHVYYLNSLALERAGFTQIYNVLHGFEGELDETHHRNSVTGWRFDGLPWEQT